MWDRKSYDFGEVNYQPKIVAEFNYLGNNQFRSFIPSCSCLDIVTVDKKVIVYWTLKPLVNNNYMSRKYVTVVFTDGTEDELKMSVKVKV